MFYGVCRFRQRFPPIGALRDEQATKHALAEHLASRFPEELGFRLPKKRRFWMSEDSRMDMFDAVALAQHCLQTEKQGQR